jgi:hypothetical protein
MKEAIFCLSLFCFCVADGLRHFPKPQRLEDSLYSYEALYFTTYVDNFDPTLGSTFEVK